MQGSDKPIPLRYATINLLCEQLESKYLESEGLMRVSGTNNTVRDIWLSLANDTVTIAEDVSGGHNVANALKLYLREQPDDPVIPFDLYSPLILSQKAANPHADVVNLIGSLPPVKYIMLQRVILLLTRIAEKSSKNLMTLENLSIVMGPTLIQPRPTSADSSVDPLADMHASTAVILDILKHYSEFFPNIEASPSVVQVQPMKVTPFFAKRKRTVIRSSVVQRPLRPRDFDMRPFINKKLLTQVSPATFEPVEGLLLVHRVEHNEVLTWTPHAQTPFILSPYYIVLTPRFFHFMDANTYRVKGTITIKQVQLMSVDTLHKGFFSISEGEPGKGTTWMFLSHSDKILHHFVDIIRKNQALTLTGRKTVALFAPKRCPILLEGGESEESQKAMAMMLQTLHKAGYNEQDIFDGSADLHEIVKRYKDILTFRGGPKYVIEFLYPPNNPDFMGIYKKSYKLDRRTPVATILRLLCAKARPGGVDTQQYVLCTLRGRTLLETENLASYGLGALFTTWQLRVMHKSHALVISGTVVDFYLPSTPDFKGTARKTVKLEPDHEVRHGILALFRHLRLPLEPHRFELVTEDGKVLRDNAPFSEYGLGLKCMTMRVNVVPRKFPSIGQDKEKNAAMIRDTLVELVDSIVTTKITERKKAKEQYCRDMLLYVLNKATHEISRASFLPPRVGQLGKVHREQIYDLLVKLENSELQRTNVYGYHSFVKKTRAAAGQSDRVQLRYMTAAEIAAHEEVEKEAEKRNKLLGQQQRHQQQAMGFIPKPPSPVGAPPPPPFLPKGAPPPPFLAKGAKLPTKKISTPSEAPAEKKTSTPPPQMPVVPGMNFMSNALFKKKAEEKAAQKSPVVERRATAAATAADATAPKSPSSRRVTVNSPPPNFAKPLQTPSTSGGTRVIGGTKPSISTSTPATPTSAPSTPTVTSPPLPVSIPTSPEPEVPAAPETSKPAEVLDETSKPAETSTDESSKPAEVTEESSKPVGVPDESTKPADESSKPAEADESSKLAVGSGSDDTPSS